MAMNDRSMGEEDSKESLLFFRPRKSSDTAKFTKSPSGQDGPLYIESSFI